MSEKKRPEFLYVFLPHDTAHAFLAEPRLFYMDDSLSEMMEKALGENARLLVAFDPFKDEKAFEDDVKISLPALEGESGSFRSIGTVYRLAYGPRPEPLSATTPRRRARQASNCPSTPHK